VAVYDDTELCFAGCGLNLYRSAQRYLDLVVVQEYDVHVELSFVILILLALL
jgi:hypothetical protein